MPLENADYFIYIIRLPDCVRGAIRLNSDGTYSMYINPDYDREAQIDTSTHELWHILRDDLYGDKDIAEIEGL